MARILVTDGEQRATLAVVRSLGKAGHDVMVCSHRRSSLAGASRYTRASAQVPDPLVESAAFCAAVMGLIRERRVDVLIPNTDASLLALLPARDEIECAIPFGTSTQFQAISDKAAVTAAARSAGLGVPGQLCLATPVEGARAVDLRGLAYPLVLKPSRSVISANGRRTKLGVRHIASSSDLAATLATLPPEAYPVLLQERIDGDGVGVFLLLHGEKLVAAFAHRRLREKPPSGGVSVYRESVPLDRRLLDVSMSLVQRFGWEGPAMVEYKVDARTGTPYVMEINARFWGSLQLAIDAGVDFPALLVDCALGNPPSQPVVAYRHGVRSRWLMGDVDHLLLRVRKSAEQLALTSRAPSRARAIVDFLIAFGPRSRGEVFRLSDPGPAVREVLEWLRGR